MKKLLLILAVSASALFAWACSSDDDGDGVPQVGDLDLEIYFDGARYPIIQGLETHYGKVVDGRPNASSFQLRFADRKGRLVVFALVDDSGSTSLSSGTYNVVETRAGTCESGAFYGLSADFMIVSGKVEIERSGNSYDIKAECICQEGKVLKLSYSGTLKKEDRTNRITFDGLNYYIDEAEQTYYGASEKEGLSKFRFDFKSGSNKRVVVELLGEENDGYLVAGTYALPVGDASGITSAKFVEGEYEYPMHDGNMAVTVDADRNYAVSIDMHHDDESGHIHEDGEQDGIRLVVTYSGKMMYSDKAEYNR